MKAVLDSSDAELVPLSQLTRRGFVEGIAASVAAAVLSACDRGPPEKIVPYVERPPEVIPGKPLYYATSTERHGYGFGLLAESHAGRPTKIEGHPKHPASLGATGAVEQAEIYTLYDPDRLKAVRGPGPSADWASFERQLKDRPWRSTGAGLHLLLAPSTSPLRESLLERLRERFPDARVHFGPLAPHSAAWAGSQLAFGRVLQPLYALDRAERIVSLGADLFGDMPDSVRYSRTFGDRRVQKLPPERATRLYAVESSLSITGAAADHRLAIAPSQMSALASALFLLVAERIEPGAAKSAAPTLRSAEQRWLSALAKDLLAHRGSSVVIAGDRQPPIVHALAHALNHVLLAPGSTVRYSASPLIGAGGPEHEIEPLLTALDGGQVHTLMILGCNPVYALPADAGFAERMKRARERVHLTLFDDETSGLCDWVLPQAHFLEAWGDTRATDGTLSFVQPLIRPLYRGSSVDQLLAMLIDEARPLRVLLELAYGKAFGSRGTFAAAVRHGVVADSAFDGETAELRMSSILPELARIPRPTSDLELEISADSRLGDGTHANNALLQELPDPITRIAWDQALLIAPDTARARGIETGDLLEVRRDRRTVALPALLQPGQHDGTVTILTGYGRRRGAPRAHGIGVDVAALRSLANPWRSGLVQLAKSGRKRKLCRVQREPVEHGRELAIRRDLRQWLQDPHLEHHVQVPPLTLLPDRLHGEPQWGMAIDLGRCTGCSACVVACQIENNVPVVGREQVLLGREMHWLRIDRYYRLDRAKLETSLQPMLCQHCEKAPCEYVCPVNATVHSPDGLNEMVYNRCVGTRFCSNNCPYKVRRFNFLEYNAELRAPAPMRMNPNVSVRARGVMEKCTYCVQRIRREGILAELEGRPRAEAEVVTACAQACPSGAIVFGSIARPESKVARWQASPRSYAVLNELGTRPRTRYLARIDNPNPELET